MKNILLLIFSCCTLFFSTNVEAQRLLQSRDNTNDNLPAGHITPGGYFDIVFDRFGNQYSLNEIGENDNLRHTASAKRGNHTALTSTTTSTTLYIGCMPGYFRIYLETGCGMDLYATDSIEAANLNVLCQVLTDISNFIPSPCTATGQTVNIWVRGGLSSGLGVATPFFNTPYSLTATGIADNTVWETLNSGVDAFKNIAPPMTTSGGGTTGTSGGATVYFHGSIALNFGGSINWHTNLHTTPVAGEEDLYTVALHEIMHIMGFCTLIDYNGRSVFDMYNTPPSPATFQYYSRYDMQLQTNTGVPLIIGSTPDCNLYQYSFNPAAGATPNAVLSPGGLTAPGCSTGFYTLSGETDNTACSTAIEYIGGWGTALPVYTPACFERGGSLSHFDDQCHVPAGFCPLCSTTNCEYYVMSNEAPAPVLGGYNDSTNPGVMKRYLTPEERQVLCDIGYNVNTTFGNAANLNNYVYSGGVCPGRQVVGFNDGLTDTGTYTFTTTSGSTIFISGPTLGTTILDNDRAAGIAMSTVSGSYFKCLQVMTGTGTVSTDSGGVGTNVTYTAGAADVGLQLLRYIPVNAAGVAGNITYIYVFVGDANCVPTACNLVTNGGFESVIPGSSGLSIPGEHCWTVYNDDAWLLATDASGSYVLPTQIPNYYWFVNGIPHPLSPPDNHHFVMLRGGGYNTGTNLFFSSSIQEQLSTTLDSGQQYTISFWALLGGPSGFSSSDPVYTSVMGTTGSFIGIDTAIACCFPNHASHLQFAVGDTYPLIGVAGHFVPAHFLPTGFNLLAEFNIVSNNYLWQYCSLTVTYTGPSGASTLIIQGAQWDDADSLCDSTNVIGIDDISIVPVTAACAFSIPGPVSYMAPPFDLFTAASVCVTGGTFSWPTMPIITGSGIPHATITTSSTFDPAAADSASLSTGGSGLITVAYTYTTSAGCVETVYTTVQILQASLQAISGIDTVCAGSTTALSDSTTGGIWGSSDTGVATVGSGSGIVTGIAGGAATISYTSTSGITATVTIIVEAVPNANFTDTGTSTLGFTYTGIITGIDSMVWSFGDGNTSTSLNPTHTYSVSGVYDVCVTAYNSCGVDSACNNITVTVPGTGVSKVSVSNVQVYPNPTSDELYITGIVQNTSYRVLNITGECMQQGTLVYGSNTLSMKTFAPGVYVLEMTGDDGVRDIVRVVKE